MSRSLHDGVGTGDAAADIMQILESVIARYPDMMRQDTMPDTMAFANFMTYIVQLAMNDEIHKSTDVPGEDDQNYINNTESLCRELLLEFSTKKRQPAGEGHAMAVKKYVKTAMLYHRVLFMNSVAFMLLVRHTMPADDFAVYCRTSWFKIFKQHFVCCTSAGKTTDECESKLRDIETVFLAALALS